MGLPDWVFPFAVVLLLIGLPVMLVTAMIQAKPAAPAPAAADHRQAKPSPSHSSNPSRSAPPASVHLA